MLRLLCAGTVVAVVMLSGCGDDWIRGGDSSGVNEFLRYFGESPDGGTVIVECGDYGYSLAADVNPQHGGTLSITEGICYSPGTAVNITAKPNTNYVFSGWTGASTSNDTTTTITMNGNRMLTANFIKPTVNPPNGGTVTTSPSNNTATATSNTDYVFSGWSGASTSNSTTTRITNNSNHETLTANFIKLNVNPPNTGTVTSTGNTATAIPNAGYYFNGWSGALTSMDNPVAVTMNSTLLLTANFKQYGSFTDTRDGQNQTYYTVEIGELTWMAQNLNYTTSDSWCYDNDPSNCEKYGRLYTWDAAMSACPSGWRLPTRDDWRDLVEAAGDVAGTKLKSKSPDWDGTDAFGFSALPAGFGDTYGGSFLYAGSYGFWWSATEYGSGGAWCWYMGYNYVNVDEYFDAKGYGLSARCVR